MENLYWWQVGDEKFENKNAAELRSMETGLYNQYMTDHTLYENVLQDTSFNDVQDYDLDFINILRENNKYIRLYYTGGFDSHTILLKFIENNIPLDETITVMTHDGEIISEKCDKEYLESALPFMKTTDIKSTVVTVDYQFMNSLYKDPEWMLKIRGGYPYVRTSSNNFPEWDEFNKQADCNITGKEKPTLIKKKDKWYATFFDNANLDFPFMPNVRYFWLDPSNIKSFIQNARRFRDFVADAPKKEYDFFNFGVYKSDKFVEASLALGRRMVPSDATGKNNLSKPGGRTWMNGKDKLYVKDLIENDQIDTLVNLYSSWDFMRETFPQLVEVDGFINRWFDAKCPFFIDIDTLEYIRPDNFDLSDIF